MNTVNKWNKEHPERRAKVSHKYYMAHREKCQEYGRQYYYENKEYLNEQTKVRRQKEAQK